MPLESILSEITTRLRQGRFPNEQSISQGIVLRVLQELGWDTWDTTIVWPEYQTGEGRADFAMCYPALKPCIFIEVKPPGKAEESVRQALDYAFHSGGVLFVVLTDGKTWSFYLTMEQGSYEERRVYKLDLFERDLAEAASTLIKYLQLARVASGEALETARTEYRSRNRRAQALAAIPEAWKELVEKGDELLVELLSDAVESKSGIRPNDNDVTSYLASLGRSIPVQTPPASTASRQSQPPVAAGVRPQTNAYDPSASSRNGTLWLSGKIFHYANAKDAMVTLLRELAQQDPSFLQRCAQHPDAHGRKRRYIALKTEDLYPDRPDLREYHETLPGGWHVATNLNNVLKKTIIKLGTEVAGLKFGSDVRVDF
jgi:predicted type IV restriction endonuclease